MNRLHLLEPVQAAVLAFTEGTLAASALSHTARTQAALLAALPPRYTEVLLGLLDRLESCALFTDESCSFSQKDLVANLQLWVDKARDVLAVGA